MDIEDFRVTDVLGDPGLLLVGPRPERLSEEDLREDASPQRRAVEADSVCLPELRSVLHEQEEKALLQLSELGQERRLSEQTQNTHVICETDYIFVEQISSPLKR